MTKTNLEKKVLQNIVLAQVASDGGKYYKSYYNDDYKSLLNDINCHYNNSGFNAKALKTLKKGYSAKTHYIVRAIQLLYNNKPCCIKTYTSAVTNDQNGYDSFITYFDISLNGKRYQVSFHTPAVLAGELKKFADTGRKTRWQKNFKGSEATCKLIVCNKYI